MKINTFSTTDFQTVIICSALGFKILEIDRSQPRYIFHFEDSPQIRQAIEKFYKGELKLDPRLVLLHTKLIKDRIHGGF